MKLFSDVLRFCISHHSAESKQLVADLLGENNKLQEELAAIKKLYAMTEQHLLSAENALIEKDATIIKLKNIIEFKDSKIAQQLKEIKDLQYKLRQVLTYPSYDEETEEE